MPNDYFCYSITLLKLSQVQSAQGWTGDRGINALNGDKTANLCSGTKFDVEQCQFAGGTPISEQNAV